MKIVLTTIALILLALAAHAQSTDSMRAVPPQKIRVIAPQAVQVEPVQVEPAQPAAAEPTQAMSANTPSPCTDIRLEYAGMCWDKTPTFNTYFSMAGYCGASGGRLPTLGELAGFTAYFGVTGIECSSDFDSGTLWCAASTGVSGKDLSQQVKSLYEVKSLFRCVRPIPR
jgi:hypothetical protein